jgi:uncharacterized protein YqeY
MLRDTLNETLKDAMRAKDQATVSTLRMVLAAIKDKDIAARPSGNVGGISDGEVLSLLQSMIKQRRESIVLYKQGNRADLVEKEEGEIATIERFLPQQMSAADVAASIKDMGKVMAILKAKYAGQVDMGALGGQVKAKLGG